VTVEESPEPADTGAHALGLQRALDLGKRDVPVGRDDVQDRRTMPLDAVRASVAAKRPKTRIALRALKLAPAADAGCAHTEPLASLAVRQTLRDRRKNTNPKIDRQSFRHASRPPTRQAV
jgi:hypothetical protein